MRHGGADMTLSARAIFIGLSVALLALLPATTIAHQTEGQITRLKLVKRQMYGRGKLDLLQARLIGA
jgi:hypothetical protein